MLGRQIGIEPLAVHQGGTATAPGCDDLTGDDAGLRSALASARPAQRIVLLSGTYAGGILAANLHGAPDAPIVIAGADPANPPVIRGGRQGLHLVNPRHVELRNLVVSGAQFNGINIDDSGNLEATARHLVLRHLRVHDLDPAGNHDAIKLSGVREFQILDCVLEHWEARAITVEGNTFVGAGAPAAFVGADGATVRFNTIYRPGRWALRILQENTAPGFVRCRNGEFTDNIIVFGSGNWGEGGCNIGPHTAPETFRFARNVWYCLDAPQKSRPRLPATEVDGIYGQDPQLVAPEQGDFRPQPGSPAARAGAAAF